MPVLEPPPDPAKAKFLQTCANALAKDPIGGYRGEQESFWQGNLLGAGTLDLPEEDTGDRQQFIFYQDEGRLQATDESNRPADTICYLGVVDVLTPYSGVGKIEHFWKGLSAGRMSEPQLLTSSSEV
ncbi:hypothetical protein BV22DRAFT_1134355 [Leucogyrophana mollusca]|uniref:Uncharacterized protein n=1 Tax=Leucogyrophana mollusca TaxID=85980 RepID=A0ACB8B0J9_9AGAM|nr:hypothetical protein BV22DRAFT_1134355 [Leucogyrophana mollusca]